ncbi:hypothetical protein ACLB2K_065127 [Fragaria x ananassa]
MASSQFHCLQSVRVSSPSRLFISTSFNHGRMNFKRKSNSLVYASTKNLDHHLQSKVETVLGSVKWDDKGLAVAIAQNVNTGAILMQGLNREAVATLTISSCKATFYSQSRSTLWTKGETSSNFINVHDIFLDCDQDSVIYLGKPDGPTCHTGAETCYYTSVIDLLEDQQSGGDKFPLTTLNSLESTIAKRKGELEVPQTGKPSWTRRLLLDEKLLCSKIREEADELCRTLEERISRVLPQRWEMCFITPWFCWPFKMEKWKMF